LALQKYLKKVHFVFKGVPTRWAKIRRGNRMAGGGVSIILIRGASCGMVITDTLAGINERSNALQDSSRPILESSHALAAGPAGAEVHFLLTDLPKLVCSAGTK
jgi:hypothetical protein